MYVFCLYLLCSVSVRETAVCMFVCVRAWVCVSVFEDFQNCLHMCLICNLSWILSVVCCQNCLYMYLICHLSWILSVVCFRNSELFLEYCQLFAFRTHCLLSELSVYVFDLSSFLNTDSCLLTNSSWRLTTLTKLIHKTMTILLVRVCLESDLALTCGPGLGSSPLVFH